MAKKHSAKTSNKSVKKAPAQKPPLIPEKYQDYFFIGIIFLAVFIFFGSAIFGNGFYASDNLASQSFETYIDNANDSGEFPQWIPYIFGGMPSYAALLTTGARAWAFIQAFFFGVVGFVGTLFSSDVARLAFYYVIYGIGMYILMRTKDHERFPAFFTAMAAVFSTAVIVWVMIGHNTKPVVFAMFPYVLLLLEQLRQRFSILHTALLIIVVHIMMEAGHIQMIFYGALTFGLYLLFELVSRLISKKEPLKVLRSAATLLIAGVFAFLMSSDRYLSTMEYTDYSTRGSAPIEKVGNNTQDSDGGNDYDYATMWSYSPGEMMLFLVPNYYGFGKLDYSGPATGGQEVKLPTYWGQKPFDDAAAYMGILVLGLAIIGFIAYRGNVFVQFLVFASLFSLLLSFGSTLPLLYDLFYYYVPSFNKFRAPSMALVIMQFAVPILAGYGISAIIKWNKESTVGDKKLLKGFVIGSAAFLGIGLLFALVFKTSYIEAVSSSANSSFQQYAQQIPDMTDFVYSSMISDWLINGVLLLGSALMIMFFVKGKLSKFMLFSALTVILLIDLWRVDFRPMEVSETPYQKKVFAKTDVIDAIKQDKDIFRVADLTRRESPNALAYFEIQNVNGYHSAKLRVYQDLLDVANMPQMRGHTSMLYSPFLWSLLNVKYIISEGQLWEGVQPIYQSQQTKELIYANPNPLPRAFYVNSVKKEEAKTILYHLRDADFNPQEIAYIEEDLTEEVSEIPEQSAPKVIEYKNESITFETDTKNQKLMFISEIYYPMWKAFVDGKETKIYKTNYAFRSIVLPAGKHKVELKYESPGFESGRTLVVASNVVVAFLLMYGIIFTYMKRKKKE